MKMLMMKPNLTNGTKLQMLIIGKEDATIVEKEDIKRYTLTLTNKNKERILSGVVYIFLTGFKLIFFSYSFLDLKVAFYNYSSLYIM